MNREQERRLQIIRDDLRKCNDKALAKRKMITATVLKVIEDEEERRRKNGYNQGQ